MHRETFKNLSWSLRHRLDQHEPLPDAQSIRLLMIRTVTGDDDSLHCSIQTARLNDDNIQSLILYLEQFFGKGTAITITCMNYIHPTLILHETSTQVLSSIFTDKPWTDPIFVGKGDLDERNRQVDMMSDTFSSASKVVVWLGKDDLRTSDIPRLLSKVASASNCLAPAAKGRPQYDTLPLQTTKIPSIRVSIWVTVMQSYHRTWFKRRLWVI